MAQQAALYTQVHPPTAVTHCAAAWLTRPDPQNGGTGGGPSAAALPDLVVVRSTQLEVHAVRSTPGHEAGSNGSAPGASLEVLASSQLFGVVESVAVLRGRGAGQRDALLLTFREAKLSVLHWDAARHELAPSSLHFFEGDTSLKQGRSAFPYPPLAATDPLGRCGAVLMFRHQLAVLPAVDSELLALGIAGEAEGQQDGGQGGQGGAGGAAAVGNSYVDNLGKAGIKEVRDAVFLHGYNEPVLALLHEAEPTWAGNLRIKKDTCMLSALSLNLTRKQNPKIFGAANLPSDASRLSAAPCGGVLVLAQHLVLYYRQGQQAGVVLHPSVLPPRAPPQQLNLFDARAMQAAGGPGPAAAQYAREHAMDVFPETVPSAVQFCDSSQAGELRATADGASVCWLSRDTAVLCLRSGQLLQLTVVPKPGGGGRALAVGRAGAAPQASCCCCLTQDAGQQQAALLFLGSAAGDSLLVSATPSAGTKRQAEACAAAPASAEVGPEDHGRQEAKRLRLESMEEVAAGEGTAAAAAAGQEQSADSAQQAQQHQQQQQQQQQQTEGPAQAGGAAAADYDSEDEEAMIYGTALIAPAAAAAATVPGAGEAGTAGAAGATAAAAPAVEQQLRYQMRVLDSLANIGPVRDVAIADPGLPEVPPYAVACSGEGKGGTLSVLRRSVVPDVITEVPLPGVLGAWAVHHRPAATAAGQGREAAHHAFLLMSFPDGTKVLSTGEELREVTESVEFAVDVPTLAAGSVCGGRCIVQVFPQGVRLLDGEESLQDVWAADLAGSAGAAAADGAAASIVAADVRDPYVALLLSDGSAALLEADPEARRLNPLSTGDAEAAAAAALRPAADADGIVACSLYGDTCGWLRQAVVGVAADASNAAAEGATYCLVCRASGAIELFALPSWQRVFASAGLADGHPLLFSGSSAGAVDPGEGSGPPVVEARLVSFGPVGAGRSDAAAGRASGAAACEAPLLLALTADHQLLAYKAFAWPSSASGGGIAQLRFRRVQLDVPPLLPPAAAASAAGAAPALRLQRLHCFEGMGEEIPFSGVFVAGQHPHWLIAAWGALLAHPHHLPQPAAPGQAALGAVGFTPFHNVNCPWGFILATGGARSGIQISQLPAKARLDAPWPRQRVAIKGTPLKVAHYAEADLFAVLTARQVPFRPFLPEEEEPGDPQASYSYALAEAAAKARGVMQGHELRLVWPAGGWQAVWRHELLPGEKALSVAAVRLRDQLSGATVPLLAVGAALPAGEDYPCGGRLLLFEVTRGEAGSGQWDGRLIYTREFKGPVTALAGLEGYLLLASGNRIETCALSSITTTSTKEDGTISTHTSWRVQRSAFYDGPMLLTSLNVVKNFVLLGDVAHSVQFVRYKDEGRQLSLLSKDFNRAAITASQFIINGSSLHLASADAAGTLRLLSYLPNHPESWKGQRLVAWGAFHLGDAASAMQRLRLQPPTPEDRTTRQAVLLASAPGSLALLAPLALPPGWEAAPTVAALRALQRELALLRPQAAGLNPGAFRRRYAAVPPSLQGGRCFSKPLSLEEQGVLDGDLLLQYLLLPRQQQEGAAEAAGLERAQLLELLQSLWRAGGTLL
ncbi:hypothetical protein ABPG77_010120 [Micractinium sp. CCAP 211/92]